MGKYESNGAHLAEPPDVGEALAQMGHRLDEMSERLPAEDEPEDDDVAAWDDSEYAYNPTLAEPDGEDRAVTQIRELFNEEINQRMQPCVDRIEEMNREQQLLSLADQYPRLREPEVRDAVAAEAQQMAQAYGNPGMETDPRGFTGI